MNINTIKIFLKFIIDLHPQSIIDAGMSLRYFAFTTRRVADCDIGDDVVITGVDFAPEDALPIEEILYNRIVRSEDFYKENDHYSLAVFLAGERLPSDTDKIKLVGELLNKSDRLLTDEMGIASIPPGFDVTGSQVELDGQRFVLISRRV